MGPRSGPIVGSLLKTGMKKLLRILLAMIAALAAGFAIFWLSRPSDVNFIAVRSEVPNSAYSHFADIDGLPVHYQEKGTGTPIVLIHGYTSSTYTWKDVFEQLSRTFRVIAVDLKGFGFTAKPDGDYTRRAQGDLVIRFLDHLKIDQAILCGNSMGGEVSLNAAVRYPQRILALVLVDSAGVTVSNTGSVSPPIMQMPFIGPAFAALALTSDSWIRDGLKKSFYDQSKVTDDRVAAYYRPLKTRGGQRAAFQARAQAGLDRVEPEIGKIGQPTLIIWGAEDQLIPIDAGRKLNSLIKGSRLVVIDQCGHVPQEEMPERLVREVEAFLPSSSRLLDQTVQVK